MPKWRQGKHDMDFLQKVMSEEQLFLFSIGHHGDDQIETILMRFTRGSSGKARAGIPFQRPFRNGLIFRPFLSFNKERN